MAAVKGLKNNRKRWNDELSLIPWDQFERLLAVHYAKQGYRVEHVGTGSGNGSKFDGGIDLKLYKDDTYTLVQCKHWKVCQVPHNDIHELIGLMVNEKADAGIFITSGEYTAAARAAAAKNSKVELLDGVALRQLLGEEAGLLRIGLKSDYMPQHDDGRMQTVDYEPRKSRSRRRSSRPEASLARVIFIYALPILFFILVIKFLPSFIGMAFKKPEPLEGRTETLLSPAATVARPSVQKVDIKPGSASKISAGGTMTPDELREWETRNAESMRILEKTVPELKD